MQLAENCLNAMPEQLVPQYLEDIKAAHRMPCIISCIYQLHTLEKIYIDTVKIVTQIICQIVLINNMIRNYDRIVNDLQAQRNYSHSSRSNDIQFPKNVCAI